MYTLSSRDGMATAFMNSQLLTIHHCQDSFSNHPEMEKGGLMRVYRLYGQSTVATEEKAIFFSYCSHWEGTYL